MNHAERIRESAVEAYDDSNPLFREEAIFKGIAEILVDSANFVMPEFSPLTFRSGRRTVTIHGFEFDEEQQILTLLVLVDCHREYNLLQPWVNAACGSKELKRAVADLEDAVSLAAERKLPRLDASDPAIRLKGYLEQAARQSSSHISLCVWTTGALSKDAIRKSATAKYHISVWDASRIGNAIDKGAESLEIDFSGYGGIDLLMDDGAFDEGKAKSGTVLIGKVPGNCLADLYFEHRTRLLQQNVRAFLNFTGMVNKGILETARTEPERFLAYNNGIATTASRVILERRAPGVYRLLQAADFQIVNGGQTTATLMIAKNDKGADLTKVNVAMKLTVVSPEDLEDLVPKISRCANSQNKVQDSDFASNNPWLVKLETISRETEAEKDSKSEGQRLRWYFERVRGQYNVDLARLSTAAQKRTFKAANPPRTKFSKTDLAVAAVSWDLEPNLSSLGPQKCFGIFMNRLNSARKALKEGSVCEPSAEDFRRLCCILIMRREAMSLCRELGLSPLLSNASLSAYAIARIAHETKFRLPWTEIWNQQQLPAVIYKALRTALKGCELAMTAEASRLNKLPSEFAKKTECWEAVAGVSMDLGLGGYHSGWDKFSIMDTVRTAEMVEAAEIFFRLDSSKWKEVAQELPALTSNATYIGCAKTMAEYVKLKKKPSDKQARILVKALLLLKRSGRCQSILELIPDKSWEALQLI